MSRGKDIRSYTQSNFYCLNCGKKHFGVYRPKAHAREAWHRKALYCIYCRQEVNFAECRTLDEEIAFKEAFEQGAFAEEAKESIAFIKRGR